jgi:hypothetical protein
MARWFRSHASKLNDPKVQRLTDRQYRAWDSFLCMASEYDGRLPLLPDAAFLLRKSEDETGILIRELIDLGFLVRGRKGIEPYNWNKWQYRSDVSTNRVKQFRERQRNVSETPSESETEADTEQTVAKATERTRKEPQDERFKLPADWQPSEPSRHHASDKGLDPANVTEAVVDYFTQGRGRNEKRTRAGWERRYCIWCNTDADRKPAARGVRAASTGGDAGAFARAAARLGRD